MKSSEKDVISMEVSGVGWEGFVYWLHGQDGQDGGPCL